MLARLNLEERALRPAFSDYTRVAEQDPTNLEAQVALSQIAFAVKNWDAFERHSEAAITLASDDNQVKVLDLARRYREAVQNEDISARSALLKEAEALNTVVADDEIVRQILIDGYVLEQRYDAALLQLDKAIENDPTDPGLYTLKIQILATLQDADGMEAEMRRMTEVFPDDISYAQNLLRFLVSRNQSEKAEAFLRQRVAEASEEDVETEIISLVQFMLAVQGRDVAVNELDSAITTLPGSYTLRALRASLNFDSGQRDAAISDMEAIIAEAEAAVETDAAITPEQLRNIKVTLATMLNQNGNKVGARGIVEQVLAEDEAIVSAQKMRARWMIEEDNTDGAINAMRIALANASQDAEAMTIMAQAYQRAGNTDLMLNFLSLAVEASGNAPEESLRYAAALRADDKALQAETILIASLRIQPGNLDILTTLGSLYVELEDAPRARQAIDNLRRLGTPEGDAAAASVELQLVALEQGTDEALALLESIAGQATGDLGTQLALVRARLENGDTPEALSLVTQLIADNPDNNALLYFRAVTLAVAQDYDTARAEFIALLDRVPTAVPAWLQLARLNGLGGQTDAMLDTVERGLEANPGSPDLLWAKASFLQQKGDIDGAIDIYEDMYARNSNSVIIANNLASLLATFRRDDASLERARVIARRLQGTQTPAMQDTYGWIQHRSGNSEEALSYLEPAARGLPEDPTVQYHLGAVYEALGRPDEALAQMRRAIEKLGPLGSTELAEEIRGRIAALEASKDQ